MKNRVTTISREFGSGGRTSLTVSTLRIMRYRLKTRKISLSAHCADTFCLCRCHGNRRLTSRIFLRLTQQYETGVADRKIIPHGSA